MSCLLFFSLRRYLRRLYRLIVRIVFGTFNRSTATTDEVVLSHSLQTAFGNFVKDPKNVFSPNWPRYNANASVPTLAKIAYHGNVQPNVFVEPVDPSDKVSVGDVLVNRGVFISAPFANRMGRAQNGTSSLTSAPKARDILSYTQVLLTMESQRIDHDIL
jgi:hypothetical protein